MTGENILIIEDDATLLRVLTDNFRHEGYTIRTACDGKQGLAAAIDFRPDLIVLDIMLPEINGYELCRAVREKQLDMPIIMLTAKGQESDIVLGLNLGADDYVTKPFSIKALLARASALLRRRRQVEPQVVRFGECELHHGSHQLYRGGATVPLTPKEFRVLQYFASHPSQALTRGQILANVWGNDLWVNLRSVDRCVTTLRKKIETYPDHPQLIQTVRDVGYRFVISEIAGD